MNQLIAFDNGNTAAHRATQIPMTVIMMKSGLNDRESPVNSVNPRYMKMKFSVNCAVTWNMYFVVSCVRRDML